MGKLDAEFVKKVKEANNIIDIIGEHVVLKKSGSNYMGLSPFKAERTPSFSVSETKQLYHCFSTGKGGDLVTFLMEVNGLSFPEAVEDLAQRASIPLPKDWSNTSGQTSEKQKRLALAYKLNRFASVFFKQNLQKTSGALAYLQDRGVSAELQQQFYLGYAPNAWDELARFLIQSKAPIDLAEKLGLLRPSQKKLRADQPDFFDLFRNRVIFPILDLRGHIAGFGGRLLPSIERSKSEKDEKEKKDPSPKYMNSPESPLFQKGKLAFGLYQAKKFIREMDEVVLVEGFFDVLALHQAGLQNTVATCGTALTPDHLKVFRRFGQKVTLLFDGDQAGIEATHRAMELGLQNGIVIHGAEVPGGEDPADVFKNYPDGAARLRSLVQNARPLLDERINQALQEASLGPEAQAASIKRVAEWLKMFRDPVGREVRKEDFVRRLRISSGLMDQAMGASPSPVSIKRPVAPSRAPQPSAARLATPASLPAIEKILLQSLIWDGLDALHWRQARDNLPPEMGLSDLFDHQPAKSLTAALEKHPDQIEVLRSTPAQWNWNPVDAQVRSTITEALLSGTPPEAEPIKIALQKGIAKIWARFSHRLRAELNDAEARNDSEKQAQLMKDYLDVQRKMKEFNRFYDQI